MSKQCSIPRIFIGLVALLAAGLNGCATHNDVTLQTGIEAKSGAPQVAVPQGPQPKLSEVARHYHEGCICGDKTRFTKHNCTHYLSNAFIEAGYTELLDSPIFTERCSAGRPVRAQEMMRWFQTKSEEFQTGRVKPNTGFWASYQEKPGWRHVTLLDTNTGKFYGTADCPTWPVQWNYQWQDGK